MMPISLSTVPQFQPGRVWMSFHTLIKKSPVAAASGAVWLWMTKTCALSDFQVVAHGPSAAGPFDFQGPSHCQGPCPPPSSYVFPFLLHLLRNNIYRKFTFIWLLLSIKHCARYFHKYFSSNIQHNYVRESYFPNSTTSKPRLRELWGTCLGLQKWQGVWLGFGSWILSSEAQGMSLRVSLKPGLSKSVDLNSDEKLEAEGRT